MDYSEPGSRCGKTWLANKKKKEALTVEQIFLAARLHRAVEEVLVARRKPWYKRIF